jgi:sugar lactone lactonase YvrE
MTVPRRTLITLVAIALLASLHGDLRAATGRAWVVRDRVDYADAHLRDVTLTPEGRIMLAPAVTMLGEISEPLLWCLAVDPRGRLHVGGGNEGRVIRIDEEGPELAFDAPEVEVHAIAFDRAGRLYAGSSPDGRVYRVSEGEPGEVFFEPNAKYIWALLFDRSGRLLVATGQPGRVHAVSKDGSSEILFESRDDHIRTLLPDGEEGFYAGTDGGGVIYRIPLEGEPSVLYDSPAREIAALATVGEDVYAAALSPSKKPARAAAAAENRAGVTHVSVTAEGPSEPQEENGNRSQGGGTQRTRPRPPQRFTGSIYRINADGFSRKIWESEESLPLSLLPGPDGGLIAGLSGGGRLVLLSPDGDLSELAALGATQVSALLRVEHGRIYAATSNLGSVYEVGDAYAKEGRVLGGVRDAGFTSTWGAITWDAEIPGGTGISFQVRSGDTEEPDSTWTDWSEPFEDPEGSVIDLSPARYLQWRANLRSPGDVTPVLKSVRVHYLPENMPPVVASIEVLPAGAFLQSSGPPQQPEAASDPRARRTPPPKRAFRRGWRSIRWTATDDNDDPLRAEVQYRAEDETVWKTLRSGIGEDFFAWDSTAMPDGVYRLRVIASDATANPPGRELTGTRVSRPFDVDNTPPTITGVEARLASRKASVQASVTDSYSVIGEAAYSLDAADWVILLPEDGVADSARELYRFETEELEPGEHSIVVRARDSAGNASTEKVIVTVR